MEETSRVSEQSKKGERVQLMADSRHARRSHSRSEPRSGGSGFLRKATERSASMSVSYHGTNSNGSKHRGRGVGVNRYKSSDNMELTSGPPSDRAGKTAANTHTNDLGASTLHGKSSVSRIRGVSRTRSSSNSKRGSSTRAPLKRAMSNDNVLPPEAGAGETVRRGRRRPAKAVAQEELQHQPSDDDDSFAEDEEDETVGQISPLKPSSRRPTKQRRDLLVLLREKKTVQLNDFCECRDNRRVLHFLLYQHKLGVDLEDLQVQVDKAGGTPVPRPIPPLYVEPT